MTSWENPPGSRHCCEIYHNHEGREGGNTGEVSRIVEENFHALVEYVDLGIAFQIYLNSVV